MSNQEKRRITAEDLYKFRLINEAEISPDGEHVVYSIQWVDQKKEKKYTNLWILPSGGGEPLQFTVGDHVDSMPRWSPDGSQIAFLSNREDEKQSQIYLIPFQGGEARQLTDMKGEFGSLSWSLDGEKILIQFRKKDQEALEREEDETKKELGVVARHVKRVFYKLDGQGYLPKERWHLWVVDVSSGEAQQLTEGDVYDEVNPRWSPDGEHIVFLSNHAEEPDLEPDLIDLFVIPAGGGEARKIETPVGPKQLPVFSPDGEWIAYLGKEGRGVGWKNISLWIVPTDGEGEARNLTEPFDVEVSNPTINDCPGGLPNSAPVWSKDGSRLFFQVAQHGKTEIMSLGVDEDGGELETVVGGKATVGGFTLDDGQSRLAYLYADLTRPAEVWVHDLEGDESRILSGVNDALMSELDLGEVQEGWFESSDGTEVQGWILTPPDFDESKTYPSILEIHGGPRTQYGYLFMHEFYYLAAQGYVVYFCNPRGSRGYGEAFSHAIWNDWGTVDNEDLMAWADIIEKKPYIDPERMGVTGGSYGGYMTVWIIGHTDRFKAAVTQRCVSNWLSMYGSSDFNWAFQREFGDEPPWENFENYWRLSPIKYIGNARTPTLVIHSENDLRCPIEQGEQVFVSLKKQGVDTEMVRFPEEPHGLSRGGRTDRRVERLEHISRWFKRYLKGD
jgi:dipeptidyl aminopeptidase/acylaminoacyl peptidase